MISGAGGEGLACSASPLIGVAATAVSVETGGELAVSAVFVSIGAVLAVLVWFGSLPEPPETELLATELVGVSPGDDPLEPPVAPVDAVDSGKRSVEIPLESLTGVAVAIVSEGLLEDAPSGVTDDPESLAVAVPVVAAESAVGAGGLVLEVSGAVDDPEAFEVSEDVVLVGVTPPPPSELAPLVSIWGVVADSVDVPSVFFSSVEPVELAPEVVSGVLELPEAFGSAAVDAAVVSLPPGVCRVVLCDVSDDVDSAGFASDSGVVDESAGLFSGLFVDDSPVGLTEACAGSAWASDRL